MASFLDSNVVLYALGDDERKRAVALSLLAGQPTISTHVINECSHLQIRVLFSGRQQPGPGGSGPGHFCQHPAGEGRGRPHLDIASLSTSYRPAQRVCSLALCVHDCWA
jgi:hypothetical protein